MDRKVEKTNNFMWDRLSPEEQKKIVSASYQAMGYNPTPDEEVKTEAVVIEPVSITTTGSLNSSAGQLDTLLKTHPENTRIAEIIKSFGSVRGLRRRS